MILSRQTINFMNLLKGNPIHKVEEALYYASKKVLKELTDHHSIKFDNKDDLIKKLSKKLC